MLDDPVLGSQIEDNIGPLQPCACLSAIYLALNELSAMQTLSFPSSLVQLRGAVSTGWDALGCRYCPKRFLTGVQNVQLLGLLLKRGREIYQSFEDH